MAAKITLVTGTSVVENQVPFRTFHSTKFAALKSIQENHEGIDYWYHNFPDKSTGLYGKAVDGTLFQITIN